MAGELSVTDSLSLFPQLVTNKDAVVNVNKYIYFFILKIILWLKIVNKLVRNCIQIWFDSILTAFGHIGFLPITNRLFFPNLLHIYWRSEERRVVNMC